MARAILVIGEPGTGKTRAIKGLNPKETVVIKPNKKELPFRGAAKNYVLNKNMFTVTRLIGVKKNGKIEQHGVDTLLDLVNNAKHIKNVVIEDLTHFFSKRVIDERATKGYDKWTELAANTKTGIIDKEMTLRPDLNIFVIGHVTSAQDAAGNFFIGLQTPGKLMDNSIKIPSYFTYVLHTFVDLDEMGNVRYRFLTNKDGVREAKTPEEMFPKYIENDFQLVVDGIVSYQNDEGITPVGLTLDQKSELEKKIEPTKAEPEPAATEEKAPETSN